MSGWPENDGLARKWGYDSVHRLPEKKQPKPKRTRTKQDHVRLVGTKVGKARKLLREAMDILDELDCWQSLEVIDFILVDDLNGFMDKVRKELESPPEPI